MSDAPPPDLAWLAQAARSLAEESSQGHEAELRAVFDSLALRCRVIPPRHWQLITSFDPSDTAALGPVVVYGVLRALHARHPLEDIQGLPVAVWWQVSTPING